jgi:hypothetical protein
MKLKITTILKSYTSFCLPKTIRLGRNQGSKKLIESDPKFSKLPNDWEFEDRLLAFLVPYLKEDIEKYFSGTGDKMVNIFTAIQLKSLDRKLSVLLKEYLQQ